MSNRRSQHSRGNARRGDGARKVLRIGIIRGPRIVEERLIRTGESVTVGESTRNTFVLPGSELPHQHRLFALKGGRYHLVVREPMHGKLFVDDAVQPLEQVVGSLGKRRGQDAWIPLRPSVRGKVQINGTTILFQFVQAPPEPRRIVADFGPLGFSQVDWVFAAFVAFSLVLNLVGYSYIQSQPPPRKASIEHIANNYIVRDFFFPELPEEDDPLDPLDQLAPDGLTDIEVPAEDPTPGENDRDDAEDDGDGEDGDANAGGEPDDELTRDQLRDRNRDRMNGVGLAAVLLVTDGETRSDLATRDLMQNPEGLIEDVAGAFAAAGRLKIASVDGDPLLRNPSTTEPGGGLEGLTGGRRRSGPVTVDPGSKGQTEVEPMVELERPDVDPGADAKAITELVGRKKGQIKACYDREIKTTPDLAGRIEVTIVVDPEGAVEEVWIVDNTTGSEELASCMMLRIRRWAFPATGETYEVTYPFSMFAN